MTDQEIITETLEAGAKVITDLTLGRLDYQYSVNNTFNTAALQELRKALTTFAGHNVLSSLGVRRLKRCKSFLSESDTDLIALVDAALLEPKTKRKLPR